MQIESPYQSPEESDAEVESADGAAFVPEGALRTLGRAQGWMMLIAVLGLINAAMLIGMSLTFPIIMLSQGRTGGYSPSMPILILISALLIIIGIAYVIGSLYVLRSSNAIARARQSRHVAEVQKCLSLQHTFFRYWCFMTLASFVLQVVTTLAFVLMWFFIFLEVI